MIVSCGEALIDFLPRRAPGGEVSYAPFPGGSPMNVAIAVGRLGAPAGFFGGLSTDLFGDVLRSALEASNVDTTFANVSDRPSTLAFVGLNGGDARYAFYDEGSAGRMLTDNDLPAFPKTVTALHFGSFSLAEEPCGSAFEALMQREQRDRVISLDVNVRPTLIRNRDGYLARIGRLVEMADIVKLSADDLDWLAPGGGFDGLARSWLADGARLVVLTRGADGAMAISQHGSFAAPGVKVTVADTIGAGDTFTAGMLARLSQRGLLAKPAVAALTRDQIADVLAFAARAAAITVSRPGADPPWLRELA
jgi:fructokinase